MQQPIWAIIWPTGRILADSTFSSEGHAWQVALGWPDNQEIELAKSLGYKAVQITVEIVT